MFLQNLKLSGLDGKDLDALNAAMEKGEKVILIATPGWVVILKAAIFSFHMFLKDPLALPAI